MRTASLHSHLTHSPDRRVIAVRRCACKLQHSLAALARGCTHVVQPRARFPRFLPAAVPGREDVIHACSEWRVERCRTVSFAGLAVGTAVSQARGKNWRLTCRTSSHHLSSAPPLSRPAPSRRCLASRPNFKLCLRECIGRVVYMTLCNSARRDGSLHSALPKGGREERWPLRNVMVFGQDQ